MHRKCAKPENKMGDVNSQNSYQKFDQKMGTLPLLQIRFGTLAVFTVLCPLVSFLFCVLWSLAFNFTQSTSTHCMVPNYLPSISAAIGGYTPQRYVWRIGIALHCTPRFLVAFMYYKHHSNILMNELFWQRLTALGLVMHCVEIGSLVGLTYVSSSENFPIHEQCFVAFMVCSLSNMLLSCLMPKYGNKHHLTRQESRSLRIKSSLASVNFVSCMFATYFYFRHNWYCEPGVYTLFALSEYVVVLTNMGFHMTSLWDFSDQKLSTL